MDLPTIQARLSELYTRLIGMQEGDVRKSILMEQVEKLETELKKFSNPSDNICESCQ